MQRSLFGFGEEAIMVLGGERRTLFVFCGVAIVIFWVEGAMQSDKPM
jgi:hypothetical protein